MSLDKALKLIALFFFLGFGMSGLVTISLDYFNILYNDFFKSFISFGFIFSYGASSIYFSLVILSPYNTNGKDGSE